MELDDLKKMNIPEGNIVELCVPVSRDYIMLRYFGEIVDCYEID